MVKSKIGLFFICLLVVFFIGYLGNLLVSGETDSNWYLSVRPDITPPDYVFGIVWPVLYFLIALSLFYSLKKSKKHEKVWIYYGINLIVNMFWSFLFFRLHQPTLALFDIVILIASTGQLIVFNWKRDKKASLLLIPYILWLLFALLLNWLIVFN